MALMTVLIITALQTNSTVNQLLMVQILNIKYVLIIRVKHYWRVILQY